MDIKILNKFKSKNKGFTLIELIVVIAIIGILIAIAMPRYQAFVSQANETAEEATGRSIYTAILVSKTNNPTETLDEQLTIASEILDGDITVSQTANDTQWGYSETTDANGNLLEVILTPPTTSNTGKTYTY